MAFYHLQINQQIFIKFLNNHSSNTNTPNQRNAESVPQRYDINIAFYNKITIQLTQEGYVSNYFVFYIIYGISFSISRVKLVFQSRYICGCE